MQENPTPDQMARLEPAKTEGETRKSLKELFGDTPQVCSNPACFTQQKNSPLWDYVPRPGEAVKLLHKGQIISHWQTNARGERRYLEPYVLQNCYLVREFEGLEDGAFGQGALVLDTPELVEEWIVNYFHYTSEQELRDFSQAHADYNAKVDAEARRLIEASGGKLTWMKAAIEAEEKYPLPVDPRVARQLQAASETKVEAISVENGGEAFQNAIRLFDEQISKAILLQTPQEEEQKTDGQSESEPGDTSHS